MAILYGTQSNGETLPVEVNEFGQLVAKGIEGEPGPPGPPGIGQLPANPFEGAILGWKNNQLSWLGGFVPLPEYTYGPYTYDPDNETLLCPQDLSELVAGEQLFMSDEQGAELTVLASTDTIANVAGQGDQIVLTFETDKSFEVLRVGDIASDGGWNQDQEWSNSSSFLDPTTVSEPLADAFDGDLLTSPNAVGGGQWFWNPSPGIVYADKVELYLSNVNFQEVTLNGVVVLTANIPGDEWYTIAEGAGTITEVSTKRAGRCVGPAAVRLDGKILVNASVFNPNLASISSINTATSEITVTGGLWSGSDGSGTAGGLTVITKECSGQGTVATTSGNTLQLAESNQQWVNGFYVTAPEQMVAARKVLGKELLNRRKA